MYRYGIVWAWFCLSFFFFNVCMHEREIEAKTETRQTFNFSHSVVSDSLWPPWTAASQESLSFTVSQSLLKLMPIESMMPSNHLILCHPLFLLPSIFPSIRVFSSESALRIACPKYWSFRFSISPLNEYSWLISFRMDWFDLAVQGSLKIDAKTMLRD